MAKPPHDRAEILIIEDDDAILAALRGDMEFEGFAVTTAQDGRRDSIWQPPGLLTSSSSTSFSRG